MKAGFHTCSENDICRDIEVLEVVAEEMVIFSGCEIQPFTKDMRRVCRLHQAQDGAQKKEDAFFRRKLYPFTNDINSIKKTK